MKMRVQGTFRFQRGMDKQAEINNFGLIFAHTHTHTHNINTVQ
jgi:hypothetical protein